MSAERGQVAELMFMQSLLDRGLIVFAPITPGACWDIGWQDKDSPPGLSDFGQVKRVYNKLGHPTINIVRHDGKRYNRWDADWLIAVNVNDQIVWKIPFYLVCHKSRMRLTSTWDKYKTCLLEQ